MTTTNMDGLNAAFAALNEQGILTEHNYWCCGSCGAAGIATRYAELPEDERAKVTGAVYYSEQDAEAAINGCGLVLRYSALPERDTLTEYVAPTRAVGQAIVDALRAQDFGVKWDGSPMKTIMIPRFTAALNEVPRGEGSTLHDNYSDNG